jgi:hypothetical protein
MWEPNQAVTIELSAADAVVLYDCLSRYQRSDPQVLRPQPSEYAALMHLLGQVEIWLSMESHISPSDYPEVLATANKALGDPAGYRS